MTRLALILALSAPAFSVDWSRYDTQLHFTASALGSYVLSDVLERTTDIPWWGRWLISTGTLTAVSWAFEELNGSSGAYREANDAHAGTAGAAFGSSVQSGVSLVLRKDSTGLAFSWSF